MNAERQYQPLKEALGPGLKAPYMNSQVFQSIETFLDLKWCHREYQDVMSLFFDVVFCYYNNFVCCGCITIHTWQVKKSIVIHNFTHIHSSLPDCEKKIGPNQLVPLCLPFALFPGLLVSPAC